MRRIELDIACSAWIAEKRGWDTDRETGWAEAKVGRIEIATGDV